MPRTGFDRGLIPPRILGSLLNPVNSSMLAVALVPIGIAFGAPPADTAYLVSALYLATAIAQPVLGRLVDLYGARRLYLAGTALVGVAGCWPRSRRRWAGWSCPGCCSGSGPARPTRRRCT